MALHSPRLLEHDELTGITEYYYFDDDTGGFIIDSVQDVEAYVEENKALQNDAPSHWRGTMHRFARIPNVILMDLMQKKIIDTGGRVMDTDAFRKWANDRDNLCFRTKLGRV